MSDRSYLSIGEVLSLLTAEFPDVTISKIRFLESQGLIDPERTPSGYRKFYETDVERLKWILRQQRENFLPLKVIRGRLGDDVEGGDEDEAAEADAKQSHPANAVTAAPEPAPAPAETPTPVVPRAALHSVDEPTPITKVRRSPVSASPAAEAQPRPAARPAPAAPDPGVDEAHEVAMTVEELVDATGLTEARVNELAKFGLIAPRTLGGTDYFDADALAVAKAAAGFLQFGIEARHLKAFKSAAEREAGLFEQIVLPLLKQRNPAARRQAAESLEQLGHLGETLRGALVRQAVRDITG